MTCNPHFDRQLQHLISMASRPGFKAHAWYRAQELDKEPLFKGIAEALMAAMLTPASPSASDDPSGGKPL